MLRLLFAKQFYMPTWPECLLFFQVKGVTIRKNKHTRCYLIVSGRFSNHLFFRPGFYFFSFFFLLLFEHIVKHSRVGFTADMEWTPLVVELKYWYSTLGRISAMANVFCMLFFLFRTLLHLITWLCCSWLKLLVWCK